MSRFTVDSSALMRHLTLATVEDRTPAVTVETEADTELSGKTPLIILDCGPAVRVANGRPETAAVFTVAIHAIAPVRADAKQLCDDVYGGLHRLWHAGTATPFGWVSHLGDGQQPARAATPPPGTTGLYTYTAALAVTARH